MIWDTDRAAKQLMVHKGTFANGFYLTDDCHCYAVNPAYGTICDGAISCDYSLKAVQLVGQKLDTAEKEKWIYCVDIHKTHPILCFFMKLFALLAWFQKMISIKGTICLRPNTD